MSQEVMFNLVYCYNKIGETAKADVLRKRMNAEFKDGDFTKRMNTPALGRENGNPAATLAYKNIYNQFIEGNFGQALSDKKTADSIYGNTYWSPQLLYIESVYYIKQREDTTAINRLNVLAATYPTSPLASKARTMADVLGRRKQIEEYLTNANIVRMPDDSATVIPDYTPIPVVAKTNTVIPPKVNTDSLNAANKARMKEKEDASKKAANELAAAKLKEDAAKKVVADELAANKAREEAIKKIAADKLVAAQFSRDSARAATFAANKARQDSMKAANALKLSAAKNAKDSARIALKAANDARLDSLKTATAAKLAAAKAARDSVREATAIRNQQRQDSIAGVLAATKAARQRADSIEKALALLPKPISGFLVNVAEPQSVMILLNRVDAVYLNEAANAFNRYHQQKLSQPLNTQTIKLNAEYTIVLVNSPEFTNASNAVSYINKVRPKASSDIVPWLESNKFSFYIISQSNLELLKQNVKIADYLKALHTAMPAVF